MKSSTVIVVTLSCCIFFFAFLLKKYQWQNDEDTKVATRRQLSLFENYADPKSVVAKDTTTPYATNGIHEGVLKHFLTNQYQVDSNNINSPYDYEMNSDNNNQKANSWSYSRDCLSRLGQKGKWVQDLRSNYASNAQYITPVTKFNPIYSFHPTHELPYRSATTYKWVDDVCPMLTINLEGLCSVMKSLSLTRIYIVGDSLSHYMAVSLWKILKFDDDPNECMGGDDAKSIWNCNQWERKVKCPSIPYEFTIKFTQNDLIDNNKWNGGICETPTKGLLASEKKLLTNRNRVCLPWVYNFKTYDGGGTVLIANTGPHVRSETLFPIIFDRFVKIIEKYKKPNDIVLWRTTTPGHSNCEEPGIHPFTSLEEAYSDLEMKVKLDTKSAAYKYSWGQFTTFNDYARDTLKTVNSEHTLIDLLDVAPMTMLRQDGHVGSENCKNCNPRGPDCLHYLMPGPIDWWAHMFYNKLLILASPDYKGASSNSVEQPLQPMAGEMFEMKKEESALLAKKSESCVQLIKNHNAGLGDVIWHVNWDDGVLADKHLDIADNGLNLSPNSFRLTNREEWWHGMFQDIDMACLTSHSTFRIEARIMLKDMKDNTPFFCDKRCNMDGENGCEEVHGKCPNIVLVLEKQNENVEYITLRNEQKSSWIENEWNLYTNELQVDIDYIKLFEKASILIHGVKGGVDIYVNYITLTPVVSFEHLINNPGMDEILMTASNAYQVGQHLIATRGSDGTQLEKVGNNIMSYFKKPKQCNQLISNHDARTGNAHGWSVNTGKASKYLKVVKKRVKGQATDSDYYFVHTNRMKWYHGMYQEVDISCLAKFPRWQIKAQIMLRGAKTNKGVWCDKKCNFQESCMVEHGKCPFFGLVLESPSAHIEEPKKYIKFENDDEEEWVTGKLNLFIAEFEIDDLYIQSFEKATLMMYGARQGVDVVVDFVTLKPVVSNVIGSWSLNKLSKSKGAVCLDGSPAAYYLREPLVNSKNSRNKRWVVFLEGGGWCDDDLSCFERTETALGSSKLYPITIEDRQTQGTGIYEMFDDAVIVYVKYCDGSSFMSDVQEPIVFQGNKKIYYRGRRILDEVFYELLSKRGMDRATELLFAGCSAGALAIYQNIDYVSALMSRHAPDAIVVGLAEAMFSLPHSPFRYNTDNINYLADLFQWGQNAWNATPGMNKNCLQQHSPDETWMCFHGAVMAQYVSTPIFIINSKYDTWMGQSNFRLDSDICPGHIHKDGSINLCETTNSEQLDYAIAADKFWVEYGEETRINLHNIKKRHGVFLTNCPTHCMTKYFMHYPAAADITLGEAIKLWYVDAVQRVFPAPRWLARENDGCVITKPPRYPSSKGNS